MNLDRTHMSQLNRSILWLSIIFWYLYAKLSMWNMAKLKCSDYGFECEFIAEGEIENVIEEFGKHTDEIHGIDYSKEALMQFILRKK